MAKNGVHWIELVEDRELKEKEAEVTRAVRAIEPSCGPIQLYRTEDGRIGFQLSGLRAEEGRKEKLDKIYRTILEVVGASRLGRPTRKEEAVQAKLRLSKSLVKALREHARERDQTLSATVEQLLLEQLKDGGDRDHC